MDKSQINTVLFDIGGVLMPDTMQVVLFTPNEGLVDRLGLNWEKTFEAMRPTWIQFNHEKKSTIERFWEVFGQELDVEIPLKLVQEIEDKLVRPNPKTEETFKLIRDLGKEIGVISNSTDFWYTKAADALNLEKYVNPQLVFLSHQRGASKPIGLYKHVIELITPEETLFIDDRSDNVYMAKYLRFNAIPYSMHDESTDLMKVVKLGLGLTK